MSDDEYASLNFDDFTEEDFSRFYALRAPQVPSGLPAVSIEVEQTSTNSHNASINNVEAEQSPFQRFRYRSGTLSVTDLVAPAW
jgi:hypothetical protein